MALNFFQREKKPSLSFWQLATIFGLGAGVRGLTVGGQLAKIYGPGTALLSIFLGNLVLWLICLIILSIAGKKKQAIETIKFWLGNAASKLAALLVIIAVLAWYSIQVKTATEALLPAITITANYGIWIGVTLGIAVALISFGGLEIIRKIALVSFPFLFLFALYAIFFSDQTVNFQGSWNFSFPGISTVLLICLPGVINLPTLFRYSRSRFDTIIGLSLAILLFSFFESFSIFLNLDDPANLISTISAPLSLIGLFILLVFTMNNLLNIYVASACWETVIPQKRNIFEFPIVGLLGTLLYVVITICPLAFVYPAENIAILNAMFIANLATTLLIHYLITTVVTHRNRLFEKTLSTICWLIGCGVVMIFQVCHTCTPQLSFTAGITTIILLFLVVLFIEETVWSIKNLP